MQVSKIAMKANAFLRENRGFTMQFKKSEKINGKFKKYKK